MTNQPNEDTVEREPKIVRMLFNDDMARAIVSGRKTVTRRPIVPQPVIPPDVGQRLAPGETLTMLVNEAWQSGFVDVRAPCAPGDILIGRECWCPHVEAGATWVTYRAGGPSMDVTFDKGPRGLGPLDKVGSLAYSVARRPADGTLADRGYTHWESSMGMPDWAARIRRRVVSVTVERVQDITEEDAVREGIRRWTKDGSVYKYGHIEPGDIGCTPWVDMARTGRDAFARLWDSIYAAKGLGWDVNPWVWRIEFASENEPAA